MDAPGVSVAAFPDASASSSALGRGLGSEQLCATLATSSDSEAASQRTSFAPLQIDDVTISVYVRECTLVIACAPRLACVMPSTSEFSGPCATGAGAVATSIRDL